MWSSNNALNCDVSFVFYSGQYGRVHIGRLADEFHSHHMPVTIKTLRGKEPYSYLGTSRAAKGGNPKISGIVFFSLDYSSLGCI